VPTAFIKSTSFLVLVRTVATPSRPASQRNLPHTNSNNFWCIRVHSENSTSIEKLKERYEEGEGRKRRLGINHHYTINKRSSKFVSIRANSIHQNPILSCTGTQPSYPIPSGESTKPTTYKFQQLLVHQSSLGEFHLD